MEVALFCGDREADYIGYRRMPVSRHQIVVDFPQSYGARRGGADVVTHVRWGDETGPLNCSIRCFDGIAPRISRMEGRNG